MMSRRAPASVVPTPAVQFPELRGRRVIVGVPGVGFRGDLRADNAVVQGSRTFIPVLTEQDYYRAELTQIEVFATLVPVDRVWVEDIRPMDAHIGQTLDAPQPRPPRPVSITLTTLGHRVIEEVADGFLRDLRAVSDPFVSAMGHECVRVCPESDWYRWALTGETPRSYELRVNALWVD
jgi:hypothetical protein